MRYIIGIVSGALVTTFLLFLMNFLIESGEAALSDPRERMVLDFVEVKQEEVVNRQERKPEPPKQPETPPPDVPPPPSSDVAPDVGAIGVAPPPIANTSGLGIGTPGVADGEYLPIVRVPPQYPQRAAQRGLEGYVIVEFTVNELGEVVDPVVTYSTSRLFERAAIKAVLGWRYKPKVVDGQPVSTPGVETQLTFELTK